MWLCVCDIPPSWRSTSLRATFSSLRAESLQTPYHFQLCNDYFDIPKGLCRYDRDDMSCQDFSTVCLLRTFPSHYSICKQHVIPAVQHLYVVFSCFLIFFCDDFTNWEYYCESAIIFWGPQTPPVPFNRSLTVHELWCIYQNNIWFLKIVVNGFQVAGKARLYFTF